MFFCEFCKILGTLILQNISELLFLKRYMISLLKILISLLINLLSNLRGHISI